MEIGSKTLLRGKNIEIHAMRGLHIKCMLMYSIEKPCTKMYILKTLFYTKIYILKFHFPMK